MIISIFSDAGPIINRVCNYIIFIKLGRKKVMRVMDFYISSFSEACKSINRICIFYKFIRENIFLNYLNILD